MAITLQQSVDAWMPVYNPIEFVMDSSNVGQPQFKYIADVYVSGSSGYFRMVCDSDPSFNQGYFNIARCLESYLGAGNQSIDNFDITKTGSGFQLAANSWVTYEVKFGEQYESGGAVTTFPNLTVTGTLQAYNAAYNTDQWLDYNGNNVTLEAGGGWLNVMTTPQTYSFDNTYNDRYLHFITTTSGTAYFAEVNTYNSAGGLIQTAKIQNAYEAVSNYSHKRQYFMAGARALNAATLYSGSQPVIDSSVAYYTVDLVDFTGLYYTTNTEFQFNNDNSCYNERYAFTLHWLNTKGGFDSYQFTMISKYKTKKMNDTYRRKLGTMANNSYTYTKQDAGVIVHDTRIQARYELTSNWVSLDDSYMLMGLIESPVVFIDTGTALLRGTITSPTESELMSVQFGNTDLSNLKIVFELSQEYNRQRG